MNKIGSWWLASYDAQPVEQMRWSALANHTQAPFRSISGKVYLTNQRLLFCPNLLDYGLGSRKWGANLDEIVQIDRQPKGGDINAIFGGGGRDRLQVTLRNG
jgi:hypothetical protein